MTDWLIYVICDTVDCDFSVFVFSKTPILASRFSLSLSVSSIALLLWMVILHLTAYASFRQFHSCVFFLCWPQIAYTKIMYEHTQTNDHREYINRLALCSSCFFLSPSRLLCCCCCCMDFDEVNRVHILIHDFQLSENSFKIISRWNRKRSRSRRFVCVIAFPVCTISNRIYVCFFFHLFASVLEQQQQQQMCDTRRDATLKLYAKSTWDVL